MLRGFACDVFVTCIQCTLVVGPGLEAPNGMLYRGRFFHSSVQRVNQYCNLFIVHYLRVLVQFEHHNDQPGTMLVSLRSSGLK